jgi:hypothetical protein
MFPSVLLHICVFVFKSKKSQSEARSVTTLLLDVSRLGGWGTDRADIGCIKGGTTNSATKKRQQQIPLPQDLQRGPSASTLGVGVDKKGQTRDLPSCLTPFECLHSGGLGGRWTEKDDWGGWCGQKRSRIDHHPYHLLDASTLGVWAAGGQERTIVSTPGVEADRKGQLWD